MSVWLQPPSEESQLNITVSGTVGAAGAAVGATSQHQHRAGVGRTTGAGARAGAGAAVVEGNRQMRGSSMSMWRVEQEQVRACVASC
jgi:hypothetical protein